MSDQSADAPAPATAQGSDFADRDEDRLACNNHVILAFAHHAGLGPHPGKLHKKKHNHQPGLLEMPRR
jgi:hypothetical protein